ncbi:MAG: hypothetical protein PHE17_16235 [Thiothrix sp.]|uniref:glucosamine inositolphosphorylceramide transferase family protein n=1 Tax=Thiothrix sp. TaxID=1032 RepID=UPI00261C267C|nr:hypothetical protein [Thiothrix sp.]MDD5394564.1 hypothetical protein [Thiothrix sp.]
MSVNEFKVALVVDGEYVSAWQHLMLERLLAVTGVSVTALIFRQPEIPSFFQGLSQYLLNGLRWFDARVFQCPVTALRQQSVLDILGDITVCDAGSPRYQQLLMDTSVDVALDLTGQAPLAEMLAWAKYGVWRHFYGNPAVLRDSQVGVREYIGKQPEIVCGLERVVSGSGMPEWLFYATTSTDRLSISRSMERTLWKMADFMPQRVQELMQLGESRFVRNAQVRATHFPLAQAYADVPASVWMVLRVLGRYPLNFMIKLYKSMFRAEQWVLLLGERQCVSDASVLVHFRKLMPPRDRFWADPFVVEHANENYIFFEELVYARGVGHLSYIKLNPDGSHTEPVKVLERPYHLSYPFIFKHQGQYYMIPETAANHSIELYRCEEFPHRWVFEKILMGNVEAYDTTLFEHQGLWWMFTSMRHHEKCLPNEALYLFYADTPFTTQWQPHPQNPIVTQAANARPAGSIIEENGYLYRPAQNCAGAYGRGLNLNLIRQWDTTDYQEDIVGYCLPEGKHDMNGVHTFGVSSTVSVSDALYVHRRLGWLDRWLEQFSQWQPPFFKQVGIKKRHLLMVSLPLAFLWMDS